MVDQQELGKNKEQIMLTLFSAARQNVSRQHSVLCNRILRENSDLNAVDFLGLSSDVRVFLTYSDVSWDVPGISSLVTATLL